VPSGVDCAFHRARFLISINQFFAGFDVGQAFIDKEKSITRFGSE
jgi:hypothetical protein